MRRLHETLALAFSVFAFACSSADGDLSVLIHAPTPRDARVQLSAALDISGLQNTDFVRRIVIDEIIVNIAALRLLGENPAIPADGQALIEEDFVLSTAPGAKLGHFPFPAYMLDDHLAVYARIDQSVLLDGSSVVVKARLFDGPAPGFQQKLSSDSGSLDDGQTSPNPDGEPNNVESPNPDGEPNREESPNPDGEPNNEDAPNPDGEPNDEDPEESGSRQNELRMANSDSFENSSRTAIPFELRGRDQVELVVSFDPNSRMNVTLGIPARRWINAEVLQQLENALSRIRNAEEMTPSGDDAKSKTVVVDLGEREPKLKGGSNRTSMPTNSKDYRLVDDDSKDPKNLRSR